MQSFISPHFPTHCAAAHVALFTNVRNSAALRSRIVRASQMDGPEGDAEREAVSFAFVDPRLICSLLHLQTAIYQAVLAHTQGSLRTKTVHSEIYKEGSVLWALNPTNNISDAIRRYGITDATSSLIVVRICSPEPADVQGLMGAVVEGDLVLLDKLADITDWSSIKKYYKLNGEQAFKYVPQNSPQEREVISEIVTSSVAMKSVAAQ
ncbi:CGI-121-domain-containing protein [Epithele typhae]|uniref:CGI-121-domain-containing protein n=1 Tax=Epithele typhae TaxID=378194 RepID=UPI002007F846|nr:CGI-121-domain-containing protein [Epithele typhae]KAH9936886.1 CGI-121-domain-containing protein [Epithele typhae]